MASSEAANSGDFLAEWKLRLFTIVWFVLLVCCLISLPVLFDATWLLVLAAALAAILIGAMIAFVIRLVARKRARGFVHDWLKASIAAFLVLCTLMAAPIFYMAVKTSTDPALLPRVVLTNGDKTVVFQGMMHIGTERFYKQVVYDAEKALSDGYVLYYEGVQPNPEGDKWFADNLAGGGDLSANYKALGRLCGLQFQLDYFGLLSKDMAVHPESHVQADVDTLDMKGEYERLMRADPDFASKIKAERADSANDGGGMASAMSMIDSMSAGQKKLSGYVCRFMMSQVVSKSSEPTQMEKVVLDFRNRKLVERILADPHNKIYITYGANHLAGVTALLQAADPRWRVESASWINPIEAPTNFKGTL